MPGKPRKSCDRRSAARAVLLTVPLVTGVLGAAVAPAGAVPLQHAASLTCRGQGVDRDARVRHRTETVIHAPLRTVWKLQADVERWPAWQASVTSAERLGRGPLRPGSAFRWTTPVPPGPATGATTLDITSTVRQLRYGSCVRWTGPAVGEGLRIDGVHVWNFTKVPGGVRVRTEETHTGLQVDAHVPEATAILRQGLEAWLTDLRTAAEARTGGARQPS
ncbi:SRPBCC family protein [Streptomyces sp. NPDC006743]|uniref:SRPBCC family protein n=1 Tax=Streptomyces sp. NPDC006743 TaxID=3154480 RepID=UPI003452CE36